jgi:uncharacterized membrane protein YtjA (UPF0391 family)
MPAVPVLFNVNHNLEMDVRRWQIGTLAVALVAGAAGFSWNAGAAQSADEAEIRRVVQFYFDGGRAGDSAVIRQAFNLENAHMLYVGQNGELVNVPIPEYVRRVGAGGARAGFRPDTNVRRVAMIDISGNAAVAKLEILTPTQRIVDYMSLLKVRGQWTIVGKIFDRLPG